MKKIILFSLAPFLFACNTAKINNQNNQNLTVTEKYWKLIEINGEKVTAGNFVKEPHFILKSNDNRIIGNSSCNSFSGTYTLDTKTNRISFSQMISTKMACIKPTVEEAFFNILKTTDNYSVKNDTLQLNKARMAPLAKFVAVYLK